MFEIGSKENKSGNFHEVTLVIPKDEGKKLLSENRITKSVPKTK